MQPSKIATLSRVIEYRRDRELSQNALQSCGIFPLELIGSLISGYANEDESRQEYCTEYFSLVTPENEDKKFIYRDSRMACKSEAAAFQDAVNCASAIGYQSDLTSISMFINRKIDVLVMGAGKVEN